MRNAHTVRLLGPTATAVALVLALATGCGSIVVPPPTGGGGADAQQGTDGGGAPEGGCQQIALCRADCETDACWEDCASKGSTDDLARADGLASCGDAQGCDNEGDGEGVCIHQKCHEAYSTCHGDGTESCATALACDDACATGSCSMACYDKARPQARVQLDDLARCLLDNACSDADCPACAPSRQDCETH